MLRVDPAPGYGFDAITGSIAGSVSVAANVVDLVKLKVHRALITIQESAFMPW